MFSADADSAASLRSRRALATRFHTGGEISSPSANRVEISNAMVLLQP